MKKKPKILISTPDYRIVQSGGFGFRAVEVEDGHDRMGVKRWKDWSVGTDDSAPERFRYFLNSIANAIELRAKRRRAGR